jgi:hypothetical protein
MRAPNVCQSCKLRKKTCDKALPACAFCSSHHLPCNYDISTSKGKRKYYPGKYFVPLRSPSPPKRPNPLEQKDLQHIAFPNSSLLIFPQTVDTLLNELAQHFLELTKLTCDGIIDQYFQTTHKWLPVLSCDSLRLEASLYQEGSLPPADFSVLLLAMLLSILPTLDPALRPAHAVQERLYTSTKSAFCQAQASICTSLRLVQAMLLIALREYTCVRPDAAYVSVITCTGLIRVLAIRTRRDAQTTCEAGLENIERNNLTWAMSMFERYE